MGHHCKDSKCHSDKNKAGGCTSKPITQCLVTKAKGNLAILKSGKYHLAEDVVGTISIQASNVCLDLCFHTIDANGATSAIVVSQQGEVAPVQTVLPKQLLLKESEKVQALLIKKRNNKKQELVNLEDLLVISPVKLSNKVAKTVIINGKLHHIRISNGTILGSALTGLDINGVDDVTVEDISFVSNSDTSVTVSNSTGVHMLNTQYNGGDGGETAFALFDSNDITVDNFTISNYTSTNSSLVISEFVNNLKLYNGDVVSNIKSNTGNSGSTSLNSNLVTLSYNKDAVMKKVNVNSNTVNNNLPFVKFFIGISLFDCSNCILNELNLNNNVDVFGSGDGIAIFRTLYIRDSDSVVLKNVHSNDNTIEQTISTVRMIEATNVSNLFADTCQINNNYVEAIDFFGEGFNGLWLSTIGDNRVFKAKLINVQSNFNRVASATNDALFFANNIGIRSVYGGLIDSCQASNNTIGSINGNCFGILTNNRSQLTVSNCDTSNNVAELAWGAGMFLQNSGSSPSSMTVKDSRSCFNSGAGIGFDHTDALNLQTSVEVLNCVFSGNGFIPGVEGVVGTSGAIGGRLYYSFNPLSWRNIVIRDCQISGQVSTNGSLAAGINLGPWTISGSGDSPRSENVIIENCQIRDTSAVSVETSQVDTSGVLGTDLDSNYFTLSSTTQNYYVWFNLLDGSSTDPAPGGIGIQVDILSTDQGRDIASVIANTLNGSVFMATLNTGFFSNSLVTIRNQVPGSANNIASGTSGLSVVTLYEGGKVGKGHGIILENSENIKILGCQLLGNQNAGIYLDSKTSEISVLDFGPPYAPAQDATTLDSNYFTLSTTTDEYYVWYNVTDGSSTDPAPPGLIGIQVDILSTDTVYEILDKTASTLSSYNGGTVFDASRQNISLVVTNVVTGEVLSPAANGTTSVSVFIDVVGVNGDLSNAELIENVAIDNEIGYHLPSDAKWSLLRDNSAISRLYGFQQDAPDGFSTTYIGNQAQNSSGLPTSNNYTGALLTSKISLQELSWASGNKAVINGNDSIGARYTNLSSV